MSNLDAHPDVTECHGAPETAVAEYLRPRAVPLGGIRGIVVNRLLPQRALSTVGAWCFLDSFGPERTGMRVLPHPHTGLQTVTWPLAGEIRHRDSLGSDVTIRPGQLNLMTAGRGVAHSEFSLDDTALSQGLQLWVALPAAAAEVAPGFEQHSDLPYFDAPGGRVTVLLGTLGGVTSPATTYTPILGAQLDLAAGSAATIAVRPDFEHAVLAITGDLDVAGSPLTPGPLLYLGTGRTELTISTETGARALLIGGEPFPDDLVMWWNFVGRDHDDIATARAAWEAQDPTRFPVIPGHTPTERIPAPTLPNVRLRPRNRGR